MDGIEFAALPMSLDIETPDTGELTADLGSLSDAIGELNEAGRKALFRLFGPEKRSGGFEEWLVVF